MVNDNARAVFRVVVITFLLASVFVHLALADEGAKATQSEHAGDAQYTAPKPNGSYHFLETFQNSPGSRWVPTTVEGYSGTWKFERTETPQGISGDVGMWVLNRARKHAISTKFREPLTVRDSDLVIQYEVKLQHGLECGGAYLKLLRGEFDPLKLNSSTPYTIMFGPDKCGSDDKVHFIFQHQNPVSKEFEEKHLTPQPHMRGDVQTHLYTLHVRKDNTFELAIDQEIVVDTGANLLENFQPPVNPPKEIDDPSDTKPAEWVDEEHIPDRDATKPDEWDEDAPSMIPDPDDSKPSDWLDKEPLRIHDPDAKKPVDWNEDEDGSWEAPLIDNPKCEESGCGKWEPANIKNPAYKGKWKAPLIKNPAYKGPWSPRKVPNPNYFEDKHPYNFHPMTGIGFEIWTMNDGIWFDNILITSDIEVARSFANATWKVRSNKEQEIKRKQEALEVEGWSEYATKLIEEFIRIANRHPAAAFGTAFAAILPIIVLFFFCMRVSAPRPVPSAPVQQASSQQRPAQQSAATQATSVQQQKTAVGETKDNEDTATEKTQDEEKVAGVTKRKTRTAKAD